MTDAVYWVTSAVLKLYVEEGDSGSYVQRLLVQKEPVAISWLHRVEMCSALMGKEARGEISDGSGKEAVDAFYRHWEEGRFFIVSYSESVGKAANRILEDSLSKRPPIPLRSLDALHLGAMKAAGIRALITADLRMQSAAEKIGLSLVSV